MFTEWTLIFFTFLMQCGVGISLFAALATVCNSGDAVLRMWRAALTFTALGGLASLLHLQNPFNALYTLTQIDHSWLAREVAMVMVYGLPLCWLALRGKDVNVSCLQKNVALLTALAGLLLCYCMVQVYQSVNAMLLWNSGVTTLGFFGTVLATGGAIYLCFTRSAENVGLQNWALAALVAGVLCSVSAPLFWAAAPAGVWEIGQQSVFLRALCVMGASHLLMAIVGVALFVRIRLKGQAMTLCWLALFFICAGEFAGRVLFFTAQMRLGV